MDTRGIGLLEVLWKFIDSIINTQLKTDVDFHDILHVFYANRGMGAAIMELNMYQELAIIDQYPLLLLHLDLSKAYETLERRLLL